MAKLCDVLLVQVFLQLSIKAISNELKIVLLIVVKHAYTVETLYTVLDIIVYVLFYRV